MIEPADSALSLRGAIRVVFRHKRKMLLFFFSVMGAVTALAFLTAPAFRSQSKLFLRLGRENAILDPATAPGQPPVVAVPASRENEINSVIEVLRNRALLEQVVDRVGPAVILGQDDLPADFSPGRPPSPDPHPSRALTDRERAVRLLAVKLDIDAVKKSNIIQIGFEGPSPEVAQAVVATLTDFYLDLHLRLNRTPGGQKFLAEQTGRLRDRLNRSEQELKELQNKTGLFVPEGQRQQFVVRIGRLRDDLLQAETARKAAEVEVKSMRTRLAGLQPTQVTARTTGVRNEAADGMRVQLYNLQLKEQELLARHSPEHPEVRQVRQQVLAARELLVKEERDREQVTVGPSRQYEEIQLELGRKEPSVDALKAKEATLTAQLGREEASLKALNEDNLRLVDLQREVDLQTARYRRYADTLEQAQIDRELQVERISNVTVVQPATFEGVPVRPRKTLYLAGGLIVALLGSLGLAWLAESLDRSVKATEESVKKPGLPALTSLPALSPGELALNGKD